MKLMAKKGFTLVELMVVIVIVGILAAVAIPKFMVAADKAKASEFPTVLTNIYSGEHTYQSENGQYAAAATQAALSSIGVDVPASNFFSYTVPTGTSAGFTAQAEVKVAFGKVASGSTATITDAGVKGAEANLKLLTPNWK